MFALHSLMCTFSFKMSLKEWILWQADANEKYAHRGAAINLFAIDIEKVSSWGSKTLGMSFST